MSRLLGSRRALFGNRNPITASYLVVGGGGGGGNFQGGGGGAGGFLTGTTSIVRGVTYTVTVGAGGTATGAGNTSVRGGQGGNSIFGAINALGGGGGGAGGPNAQTPNTGGSGGGGSGTAGASSPGAAGTAGQGFAGGNGVVGANYGGGGGGGAGAVGLNGTTTAGAAGGAGLASSITGVSVTYAGGGGGGIATPGTVGGAGGAGGGGAGAGSNVTATSGTANTGGGGGGGYNNIFPSPSSGAGGSGVVILSIPTAQYNGFVTGTAVTTISGSNTILTFTGSGTVTFPRLPALTNVFAGAAAAYAVRLPANSTYYGPLIRVRRSNDNAEQDIYPVATPDANGDRFLDTTALLAFTGANNGFVTTRYDLTGNGRHETQTTSAAQPRIVNAGVVDTAGGIPTIVFSGAQGLVTPITLSRTTYPNVLVNTVYQATNISSGTQTLWGGDNASSGFPRWQVLYFGTFPSASFSVSTGSASLVQANMNNTNRNVYSYVSNYPTASASYVAINGTQNTSFTETVGSGALALTFGAINPSLLYPFTGNIQESIVWFSAPTVVQRQALERNQGTAYGITVA
jgi:hypothetical protein